MIITASKIQPVVFQQLFEVSGSFFVSILHYSFVKIIHKTQKKELFHWKRLMEYQDRTLRIAGFNALSLKWIKLLKFICVNCQTKKLNSGDIVNPYFIISWVKIQQHALHYNHSIDQKAKVSILFLRYLMNFDKEHEIFPAIKISVLKKHKLE